MAKCWLLKSRDEQARIGEVDAKSVRICARQCCQIDKGVEKKQRTADPSALTTLLKATYSKIERILLLCTSQPCDRDLQLIHRLQV